MPVLYVSVLFFNLVALLMRKNLRPVEYYGTVLFGIFNAELADRFTDKYDLYGFFSPWFVEVESLWVVFGIYPAAAMMIVNWYPYHGSWPQKGFYLLGWAIFSSLYEWVALQSGFLYYHHWKLWYSFFLYPFLYSTLFLNLRFVRWLNRSDAVPPRPLPDRT